MGALNSAARPLIAALSALGVLQAVLLVVTDRGYPRILGVVFLIAGLNARIRLLAALAALIVVNFAVHLASLTPPFPYRLAHVAILVMYGAVGLAGLAAVALKVRLRPALIVAMSPALAFIASEALIEGVAPLPAVEHVTWIGRMQPHPVVGEIYPPYSLLRTLYPDNPRGYFDENVLSPFRLAVRNSDSEATLEDPSDRPGQLRVKIARADVSAPSDIQLIEPGLNVNARQTYELSFRARAERPRPIAVGLSMAHAPFTGLGFYREVALDKDWHDFFNTFAANADEANAGMTFDLGASPASVELAHVVLRQMPSGEIVRPAIKPQPQHPLATEYSVAFELNALGCRGRDYPIPRPADRHRILLLGAGSTLGVGVHEPDTFAARLERSLNGNGHGSASESYEVINCGATAYTAREERLFYDQIGSQYEPNVVLVMMDSNDRNEERPGHIPETSRLEQLLATWRAFQNVRQAWQARAPDYSETLDELLKLAEQSRERHARLAVVIFSIGGVAPEGDPLTTATSVKFQGTDVPVLDLRLALLKNHAPKDLRVHAIDAHPNEVSHRIAAQEIERFLKGNGLID